MRYMLRHKSQQLVDEFQRFEELCLLHIYKQKIKYEKAAVKNKSIYGFYDGLEIGA